ncbi:MAG: SpoIIE family protein phosphatase [Bacteroidales bacterium]|nr:SpoIIE family protein phosphatase [Bacteroidales bacterium]
MVLDTNKNSLAFSSAGAILPLHFDAKNNEIKTFKNNGVLLGLNNDSKYISYHCEMKKGDKFLFFTDGYTEVFDDISDKIIGFQGIKSVFETMVNNKKLSAIDLEEAFISKFNLKEFVDDRTMLLITNKEE